MTERSAPINKRLRLAESPSDLNDFFYFAKIVMHSGFSSAAKALGIPKSRLSRRLAALEARLGVRLLQRSTRRLALTQAGRKLMQRCETMFEELETGIAEISELRRRPMGKLKVGCSMNAARVFLGSAVTGFVHRYPDVQVEVRLVGRELNLYEAEMDVIFHVTPSVADGHYVAKRLFESPQVLVASSVLLQRHKRITHPSDLCALPALHLLGARPRNIWVLQGPDGSIVEHTYQPRVTSDDLEVLHQAALRGAGVVRLPTLVCANDLAMGTLQVVLPEWRMEPRKLFAIFHSRHGLTPVARLFVDYVGEWFEAQPNWRGDLLIEPDCESARRNA
ncbi:MAG: Transcriptional regulator, LysR family [Burkholderiales bacterium]|jgi:DNA-binding transcriptional LysR family regulator|nr:Transcriptional regulator, LysR family [Burkholderiales bacterium]